MIRKRTEEGHTEATGRHRVENAVRCRGEKNDGEGGERACLQRTTKKSGKPADQKREEERVGETPMSERKAVGNPCQESQCIDVRKRACDTGRGGQWRRHARRPESDGDRERNGGMRKDRRHPGILGAPVKSRSCVRGLSSYRRAQSAAPAQVLPLPPGEGRGEGVSTTPRK